MAGVIQINTGNEGGGKSAWMTNMAGWHGSNIARYYGYPTLESFCSDPKNYKPIRCFPGYKLHGLTGTNLEKLDLSETISFQKWMKHFGDDEHRNMLVCIDEMQNNFDSLVSNAVATRVFSHAMAQRRRSAVSVLATCQNWDFVPGRIRFFTHLVSVCSDLYWTPWGKSEGVKRGENIKVVTFDAKGMYTGEPWSIFNSLIFHPQAIWGYYDSFDPSDFFEGESIQYQILKTKRYINEDGERVDEYGNVIDDDYNSDAGNMYYDPESGNNAPLSDYERKARFAYAESMENPTDAMIDDEQRAIRDLQAQVDRAKNAKNGVSDIARAQQMVRKLKYKNEMNK